jgi:hypothetical protein
MVTSLFDIDFGFIPQRNVKGYNLYPPPGWLSYVRMSACFTKEYWRYITRIFPKTTPCRWLTFIRIGGSLCSELVAHFGAEYTGFKIKLEIVTYKLFEKEVKILQIRGC